MFGRYQLLLEMARGGMAALYLARLRGPEQFEKLLVVKLIHEHLATEEEFIQMFLDEARITAMIQHPNVAAVQEMGKEGETYYLAMEYIHGQNMRDVLRSAIRNKTAWHWSHAVHVLSEAAAGLHAAHELVGPDGKPMGVVHRDVSPQNILLSYGGDVKVIDFGIAYAAERLTQTRTGTVKGKAAYMSPEHVCGEPLDCRSDIFSLGVVLYEAVTLRRLFRAENEAATLLKVRDCVIPPPRLVCPELPVELEQIILKALAPAREDRFASAGDLSDALQELLVRSGHRINRRSLGEIMDRLFHDRRVIREQQIKLAQEEDRSYPAPALGVGSGTHASSTLAQVSELQHKTFRPSTPTIVGGVLVLLAVAAMLFFLLGRGRYRKPTSSAQRASAGMHRAGGNENKPGRPTHRTPPRPPVLTTPMGSLGPSRFVPVTIEIRIKPSYAKPTVKFRGKLFHWRVFKGNVFRMIVPRTNKEESVQIRAKGFNPEDVFITATQDVSETVTLLPDGTARPPKGHRAVSRPMRRPPMRRRPMRPRPSGGVIDLVMDID